MSGEAQRDCALKLVSLIVAAYGIEWLNADTDEPCLFLMLVVRLACIEVQMILEEQSFDSVSNRCHIFLVLFNGLHNKSGCMVYVVAL